MFNVSVVNINLHKFSNNKLHPYNILNSYFVHFIVEYKVIPIFNTIDKDQAG